MPLNLDASAQNADWTKRTPDIGVETRAELDAYLREQSMTLEDFKRLPIYEMSRAYWDAIIGAPEAQEPHA